MLPLEPHHVIAIGASAGGMEEINSFFDHTPLDGVSYIIIQHLSADFKSRMVELLARHSKLEVIEAVNEMAVKCNQVYLIPNDKFMTISDNKLYLTDKDKNKGPHLTINRFFNSLALNSGPKAIGVVLSGLGSDGTEGIKAIKNEGGMVIARNPETSEFGSMPTNAIATGLVDYILEPELMPATIEDYIKKEAELLFNNSEDEKNLSAIINLIKDQSPHDFTEYKQSTILRRIKRRAAYNNFNTLENYYDFLKSAPDEIEALSQDFLISVTSFFRDKEAFDSIQKTIIPDILRRLIPTEELKIWVAGCATGEEAYSLAIIISEQLTGNLKDTIVKIFATDIDKNALAYAGRGIYNDSILKDITPERLEKYFSTEGTNFKVKPVIRKMVIFAHHDLVKNPPYCNMHFISCRNLLIYMAPSLQKKIFVMLLFGLKMKGYLFLGSSESPLPIIQNLEVVDKKWKIYKNLETKRVVHFDGFSLPHMVDIKDKSAHSSNEEVSQKTNNTLTEAVNEALVKELNVLVVCVDEKNHVLKNYGDTTKYVLQKNFTQNLSELLPRPLSEVFNSLTSSALKANEKMSVNEIKIKQGDDIIKVNLSITPLHIKNTGPRLMVTFKEVQPVTTLLHNEEVYDEKVYHNQYTLMIEEELNDLKDKLHSTYEQLDASNDNMQSFNEELLSANEEMQSTNEEMQSVNEELHTINTDYQLKNKELQEVNDDLDNYFRSNINGQLFVNTEMLLMRFSPGTVKQINLLPTDIGRPLSNISTNIKFETIIDDIKKVMQEGTIITREIETKNGRWYQIMTMPYIQQVSNKTTGAIITFNDISELKATQLQVENKNQSLVRINQDLDNFVHTASHDLLAPLGNIEMSIATMSVMKPTGAELSKFLEIINSSIKKFRNLIKDIATIAKIEGNMSAIERVTIEEIIKNVEWSLENNIKLSGAIITSNLEVKEIMFSKKNFRSILFNLISNAIKFKSQEKPIITIHTFQEGEDLVLSVEDNGIGIDMKLQSKIFELYGRIDSNLEGDGIGLYLTKKIVTGASGNIVVESKPGNGSKFIIRLKNLNDHLSLIKIPQNPESSLIPI